MSKAEEKPDIHHNTAQRRFEITLDGRAAELTYHLDAERITFAHTGVPAEFQGRGIGGMLVKAGLEFAEEQNLKVIPLCSFVATYIERHPQYQRLLA